MRVTFFDNGRIMFERAPIKWTNFAGNTSINNRDGKRKFSVPVVDEDLVQELLDRGFNVKIKPGYDPYFDVMVSYKYGGPTARLRKDSGWQDLTEETIGNLDGVEKDRVDFDVYLGKEWTVNGVTARTAYLTNIAVWQSTNSFWTRFAEEEYPGEAPFN